MIAKNNKIFKYQSKFHLFNKINKTNNKFNTYLVIRSIINIFSFIKYPRHYNNKFNSIYKDNF